jgi:hypothetical protein
MVTYKINFRRLKKGYSVSKPINLGLFDPSFSKRATARLEPRKVYIWKLAFPELLDWPHCASYEYGENT